MARPVFVSDAVAKQVLAWPDMIATMRQVYSVEHPPFAGPPRTLARGKGIWMRTLTGVLPSGTVMGVKQFCFPRGRRVRYMISLFDQDSGELLALLDANTITAWRTGATTAMAIDRMAPPGKARIAMLGSGAEAHAHARAIATVRPIESLTVYSPTPARREAFARLFADELGIECRAAASARLAVEGATIIVGATRTLDGKPALEGAWLAPGMLVASIGATLPEHVEIDGAAIERAQIIVADMPHEVMDETGCFLAAKKAGLAFAEKFVTLNDMMRGLADDRLRVARHPMFRSVGQSLQDLAVAELAWREAVKRGLATELAMELAVKSD
jgi:ornithine cyclodeaminase/alanine dehydrogenase-like protein (mu-crystallin family)